MVHTFSTKLLGVLLITKRPWTHLPLIVHVSVVDLSVQHHQWSRGFAADVATGNMLAKSRERCAPDSDRKMTGSMIDSREVLVQAVPLDGVTPLGVSLNGSEVKPVDVGRSFLYDEPDVWVHTEVRLADGQPSSDDEFP